jgi:limonene 1,2-monooxygenase
MLCVAAGEHAGFNALDVNWRVAQEVAAEHGRTMDPSRLRLVVSMHLAETREKAAAAVRFGLKDQVDYLNNNMPRIFVPDGVDTVDWYVERRISVIGTPDDAIARIQQLADKQGEFGAILLMAHDWADWEDTKRSYELYARYVMPHFSGANEARFRSYDWVTKHQSELSQKRQAAAQDMIDRHEAEWKAKGAGPEDTEDGFSRPAQGKQSSFG